MKKYIHKKTGRPYRMVTDNFMIKENGEWRRGFILYETLYDNPTDASSQGRPRTSMRTSRKSRKKKLTIIKKNKNMADVKEDWFVNLPFDSERFTVYDPEKETAYLLKVRQGTYDLYTTFPVTVKRTLEAAQKLSSKHEEVAQSYRRTAVKER